MPEYRIELYDPSRKEEWDGFVGNSRNATFLFRRGYMDYHADRFTDRSYMIRRNGRLAALLPANITSDGIIHSHQGLTYGGLLLPQGHIDGSDVLAIFVCLAEEWRASGILGLDYKEIPWIYPSNPSQEDIYALFRLGARQQQCGLSSAVDLAEGVRLNQMQRRHLKKSVALPFSIEETDDVAAWMPLLEECLAERHSTRPVHTAEELQMLKDRFPRNIRLFGVRMAGAEYTASPGCAFSAGVCVYDTGRVAHLQYIATTASGRESNLLTPLIYRLMTETFSTRRFFDFGISTEDGGRSLNAGLLRQKFSYGGGGVTYNRYYLDLNNDLIREIIR